VTNGQSFLREMNNLDDTNPSNLFRNQKDRLGNPTTVLDQNLSNFASL